MKQVDFSIITVCYNAQHTISATIESVMKQSGVSFEHIIIDGVSTDDTLGVIASHKEDRIRVYSEPDKGIYDAMNKGLLHANGTYLVWLNSDDVFKSYDTLQRIFYCFKPDVDVVCSSIEMIDHNGKVKRRWPSRTCLYFGGRLFVQAPHPGFFVRAVVFKERQAKYDPSLQIAADMDVMLDLFTKKVRFKFSDIVSVKMLLGGASTKDLHASFIGWKETFAVLRKYYGAFAFSLMLLRALSKYIAK